MFGEDESNAGGHWWWEVRLALQALRAQRWWPQRLSSRIVVLFLSLLLVLQLSGLALVQWNITRNAREPSLNSTTRPSSTSISPNRLGGCTAVTVPSLPFFCANEAHLRAAELALLGLSETAIWGEPSGEPRGEPRGEPSDR